jgi:hypothetical protein
MAMRAPRPATWQRRRRTPPAVNRTAPLATPSASAGAACPISASVFEASRPPSTSRATPHVPAPPTPRHPRLSTRFRRPPFLLFRCPHGAGQDHRNGRSRAPAGRSPRGCRCVGDHDPDRSRRRHFGQAVPERPEPVEPKMRRREAPPVFHRHRADGGQPGSQAHQRRPVERRDRAARLGGLAHGDRAAGKQEVDHTWSRLNRTARSRR